MDDQPSTSQSKVTIRTVATDAGVSVAAVSKVLRDAYGVSEALREKVQASIDRLGYRPSTAARAMRGQTYTVGLLMVEISNPFLPAMVEGINAVLGPAGYKTLIGVGEADMAIEKPLIDSMIDNRMDGLILIAPRLSGAALAGYARQIPMAVLGHHEPTADSFDTVNADDYLGACLAVRALLETSDRPVQMISLESRGNGEIDVYCERERGYISAMNEAGRGAEILVHRLSEARGKIDAELNRLVDQIDRPTAIFCWSDLHAIRLIDLAKSRGLRVPQDLAVVGYDNSPMAAMSLFDLASIDQHGYRQGTIAARMLLERIEGRQVPQHILITPDLIARGSMG